jgi:hypothetical protein
MYSFVVYVLDSKNKIAAQIVYYAIMRAIQRRSAVAGLLLSYSPFLLGGLGSSFSYPFIH